jgi:hypothetical protein
MPFPQKIHRWSHALMLMVVSCLALQLWAVDPPPPADKMAKAVSAGDNGQVDFSTQEVKFEKDIMELSVTPKSGLFKANSATVKADAAAVWTIPTSTESLALYNGVVGALDNAKKGKTYNPKYAGEMKTGGGTGTSSPPAWQLAGKYETFKVEITDKNGTVITAQTATVAIKDYYIAKVTPDRLDPMVPSSSAPTPSPAKVTYKWTINKKDLPKYTTDNVIKSYTQSIISGPTMQELVAGDLTTKKIDFFWTNVVTKTVVRVEATCAGHTESAEVEVTTVQEKDPNREIYARLDVDVDEDHNPHLYGINTEHRGWHKPRDPLRTTSVYPGKEFFDFHRTALLTVTSWRSFFHMKAITFPAVGIPEETYLTDAGGSNESPIYGYVRRGEFLDLEELGDETVDPWHDEGHVALVATDGDMGKSSTAIHSKEDLFWQWHKRVDDVRATFSTDMAKINSTTPADLQTITAPLTTFIVTFKLPVSCKPKSSEPAKNGAQIKAEFLTLNGIKATDVHVSADYKTLTFDVTMPISGAVRAVFTGTRSVAAFDVTFTVQP